MKEHALLAIPSLGEGGLEGERSEHFGQCDCFTLVEVIDDEIREVCAITNPHHEHGDCLGPVSLLASHRVDSIVVVGMGARPLIGFNEAGIAVYSERQTRGIGEVVRVFLDGGVELMDPKSVCGCH